MGTLRPCPAGPKGPDAARKAAPSACSKSVLTVAATGPCRTGHRPHVGSGVCRSIGLLEPSASPQASLLQVHRTATPGTLGGGQSPGKHRRCWEQRQRQSHSWVGQGRPWAFLGDKDNPKDSRVSGCLLT